MSTAKEPVRHASAHAPEIGLAGLRDDEADATDEEHDWMASDVADEGEEPHRIASGVRVAACSHTEFWRGDEVEIAQALVADLGSRGPTVCAEGDVYTYDPQRGIFRVLDDSELSVHVQRYAGTIVRSDDPHPLKMRASHVAGAIRLARDQVTDPSFFAKAVTGLAFRDCFVTVTAEGMIHVASHAPDHRARLCYAFAYDDGPSVEWLRFLDDLVCGDKDKHEKVALLGEFFGGCLLGVAPRFQKCIISRADGGAGRSTFLRIMSAAMPAGSVSTIPPQKLSGDDNRADYHRAMLVGRRLNMVSELPETDIMHSEAFKAIVTGDEISARHPAGRPFKFSPLAGHFFAANALPAVTDQTEGFWRRFLMLPFNRRFHETGADLTIADRIIAGELPRVVAWLLKNGARLLKQGAYTIPESHHDALAEWRRNANVVRLFLDEMAIPHDTPSATPSVAAADLYKAFVTWAKDNGHRGVLASNTFGQRMKALGFPSHSDGKARRYPFRLRTPADGEP